MKAGMFVAIREQPFDTGRGGGGEGAQEHL